MLIQTRFCPHEPLTVNPAGIMGVSKEVER